MSDAQQHPLAVHLTCKNAPAAIAFYRDKLGFTLKESWPSEDQPMWGNLVLDGQSVMVGAAADPEHVGEMCAGDEEAAKWHRGLAEEYGSHRAGVGVLTYVMVPDVDAYHAKLVERGVTCETSPKTQFYGIRDFGVKDPEGYRVVFYSPVTMESCQSCGMPLAEAEPGQMYCSYCTDDNGHLKPYDVVLEGTIQGYFMGMQKMPREQAEQAAREHLAKMPAWVNQPA
jgi:uncharacterized glyoxalase superfamily protein PhnB